MDNIIEQYDDSDLNEQLRLIDHVSDSVHQAMEDLNTLNNLNEIIVNNNKLSQETYNILKLTMENISNNLGLPLPASIATESINNINIAMEGIMSFIKSIIDAIVKAVKWIWDKIMSFIDMLLGRNKNKEAQIKATFTKATYFTEILSEFAKAEKLFQEAAANAFSDMAKNIDHSVEEKEINHHERNEHNRDLFNKNDLTKRSKDDIVDVEINEAQVKKEIKRIILNLPYNNKSSIILFLHLFGDEHKINDNILSRMLDFYNEELKELKEVVKEYATNIIKDVKEITKKSVNMVYAFDQFKEEMESLSDEQITNIVQEQMNNVENYKLDIVRRINSNCSKIVTSLNTLEYVNVVGTLLANDNKIKEYKYGKNDNSDNTKVKFIDTHFFSRKSIEIPISSLNLNVKIDTKDYTKTETKLLDLNRRTNDILSAFGDKFKEEVTERLLKELTNNEEVFIEKIENSDCDNCKKLMPIVTESAKYKLSIVGKILRSSNVTGLLQYVHDINRTSDVILEFVKTDSKIKMKLISEIKAGNLS